MATTSTHIKTTAKTAASTGAAESIQTGRVVGISAAHAVHDAYAAFLAPLLPAFISALTLSKTQAGLLSVFMLGPSVIQPFLGYLSDRANLRALVILGPAVAGMAMSMTGIAPSYGILALFLVIAGLASSGLHSVGPVMVGDVSGKQLGRGLGLWMVGGSLGYTLGPLVIATFVQVAGIQRTPWLMLGGFAMSALLYVQLRHVRPRATSTATSLPVRRALRAMAPLLLPLSALVVLRAFMESALATFLPVFMTEEGSSLWIAGVSLSILEAAGLVGAMLGGRVSDRVGRRPVFMFSLGFSPLLLLLFVSLSGWARIPVLLGIGFSLVSVMPVILALLQESYPENRALANGIYMLMNFALRSIVTVGVGAMADYAGLRFTLFACAIISLFALPVVLLIPFGRTSGSAQANAVE